MNVALPTRASAARWAVILPGAVAILGLLALFRDTAVAMVGIWSKSDTYAHAYLVVPIVLWMVWRKRATLDTLPVRPAHWALVAALAMCVLWLLGELGSMNSVTQFALVALLAVTVPAVFGRAVALALLFPLFFLFFAVPLGEFLIPVMMDATADFTVTALQLSGVPVYREGLQFVIPSGSWSVVSACSGVRYLIASFMVGTLFAYLNYRSPTRRAIFMVLSLVVPVIANWLRAYMIVMLGHLSDNQLAVGVDHLIYGWVFFGVVIGLMFMIGARWSEPEEAEPQGPVLASPAEGARSSNAGWLSAGALLALGLATQAVLWKVDQPQARAEPVLRLPAALGGDWQAAAQPLSPWVPSYKGARTTDTRTYESADAVAAIWAAYYVDQGYENKLVTSANFVVSPVETAWGMVAGGRVQVNTASGPVTLQSSIVRASASVGDTQAQRLLVWHVYWIGDSFVSNDVQAKLLLAWNRLRGRGDDAAVLMFYAPLGGDPAKASSTLQRLVGAQLPLLERSLKAVRDPGGAAR